MKSAYSSGEPLICIHMYSGLWILLSTALCLSTSMFTYLLATCLTQSCSSSRLTKPSPSLSILSTMILKNRQMRVVKNSSLQKINSFTVDTSFPHSLLVCQLTLVSSLLLPVITGQTAQPAPCRGKPRGHTVHCGRGHHLGNAPLLKDCEEFDELSLHLHRYTTITNDRLLVADHLQAHRLIINTITKGGPN